MNFCVISYLSVIAMFRYVIMHLLVKECSYIYGIGTNHKYSYLMCHLYIHTDLSFILCKLTQQWLGFLSVES